MITDIGFFFLLWLVVVPLAAIPFSVSLPISWGKTKRKAFWAFIFILPFSEEIYLAITFDMMCKRHTGFVINEPIQADIMEVAFRKSIGLLEVLSKRNSIERVYIAKEDLLNAALEDAPDFQENLLPNNGFELRKNNEGCENKYNKMLSEGLSHWISYIEGKVDGDVSYCLDDYSGTSAPRYKILSYHKIYRGSAAPYPKNVGKRAMQIIDNTNNEIIMSFVDAGALQVGSYLFGDYVMATQRRSKQCFARRNIRDASGLVHTQEIPEAILMNSKINSM